MAAHLEKTESKFSDLGIRLVSAIVLIALGLFTIFHSSDAFSVIVIVVAGLLGWEVFSLHSKASQLGLMFAALMSACLLALMFLPFAWFAVFAILCILAIVVGPVKNPLRVFVLSLFFIGAGASLIQFHQQYGPWPAIWLIATIVATDVGGYFAGKMIGGPKLWPAVSPKKTWSGTIGGWVLAGIISILAIVFWNGNPSLLIWGVALSVMSQAGDIGESWVKRKLGVKDSSSLIPGHGGLWDRFDGVLTASLTIGFFTAIGKFSSWGPF